MMIEALVRWTEMRIKKNDSEETLLKRIVEGDENAVEATPEFYYDISPMTFELDDVIRFNRSKDLEYTTLRFKDGEGFIVKIAYEDFKELWVSQTGRAIFSILEEENTSSENDLEI